jgi:uncharacterized RDD family membrane protein YckC
MNNQLLTDYASKSTRFLNLFLDRIIYSVLFIVHLFIFDRLHVIPSDMPFIYIVMYMFSFYFLYYFLFELAFGRTPGKFLTGTKVVDFNDRKPDFKTLFIRNLCRFIPFNGISFLVGNEGWHDSISKTNVIHTQ